MEILTKAADDSVKEPVALPVKETPEERMERLGRLNAWKVSIIRGMRSWGI